MEVDASQFANATPNDIIELIKQTLSGDNQKIKSATKILKAYTKHKSSISTLTYILVNAQELSYRQMATILLKRNLVNLYGNLSVEEQKQFRDLLLGQYIKQTHLLVQKGIATLISILLPIVQIKNWLQLQNLLDEAIRSAPQSAATFVLLNSLLYHFKPPKQLYIYLFNALKMQKLVDQAIKCVNAVVQTQDIDPSFAIQLIKIWSQQHWGEELSLQAFQILNTMVQRRFKIPEQVTFWVCDKIISNKKLSNKLRTAGCDYLFTISDFYPKLLTAKDSVLKKVIETVCFTCSQPYHPDQDQETGQYVQQIALWLIETLSITIKAKKIYPVLFEAATSLINSNDKNQANTGFLILGSMSEGCNDKLKRNLQNPVMNVLIPKGLQHEAPQVRGAAINALCFFSEYLIPDIFQYHSVIIPAMIKYIGDLSPKVCEKALIAIDVFLDGMMQEDIIQYLPIIVPKLIEVLVNQKSTSLMRAASMSGLGSAVTAAQQKFEPYVQAVLQTCNKVLQLPPSPELNSVRAQNLNVLGKVANAFCRPEYKNSQLFYTTYIMPIMQKVYQILMNEKDNQMRESSFAFFYLIANAIGTQFQPIFDNIIGEVLNACKLWQPEKKQKKNDFSLDSDSEQQMDALPTNKVTAYDQKASAIHALGQLAKACPMKFIPHFERAHQILEENYQFFYENIRIQVCNCYTNLTLGYIKSKNGGILPKFKKGLPCIQRFTPQIEQHFRTMLIPRLIFLMTQDQQRRVRGAAVQTLDELCKQIGPVLVDRSIQPIKDAIIRLLETDVVEQNSDQQEEPEEEQTEIHTFQTLCDLIPTLCDVLRTGFQPTLSQLHPYLMKFLQQRQDINDNVQMTGCLSQCFKFIPGYVFSHTQQLFKSLAALISLQDTDINRNIAYAFAEMFEKASKAMTPYLQDGLAYLKQIFDHPGSSQPCKDNAVGAICRIIYTFNPPMPYQVFIQNLVKMMPFQGDQQQQNVALKTLIFLWNKDASLLQPYKQKIVQIVQNDLNNTSKYHIQQPLISQLREWVTILRQ